MGVRDKASNMTVILWVSVTALLSFISGTQGEVGGGYCCPQKTATDVGDRLNGVYTLKEEAASIPQEGCKDSCVYYKDGNIDDLYCFRPHQQGEPGNVKCEAASSPFSGLFSSTTSPPTTTAQTVSTTPDPELLNLEGEEKNLQNNITSSENELQDVTEELATANETEAVLDTVDEKIENITGIGANDTDIRSRMAREIEIVNVTCKLHGRLNPTNQQPCKLQD